MKRVVFVSTNALIYRRFRFQEFFTIQIFILKMILQMSKIRVRIFEQIFQKMYLFLKNNI